MNKVFSDDGWADYLVYRIVDGAIWIAQCRTHYGDH
jgi:hypothetical protein